MNINLARKDEEPRTVRFIDLNKERPGNWQYIDIDKFEAHIREDETRKWVEKRRRERARQKLRKEAFWSVVLGTLAIRLVGLLIFMTGVSISLYFHAGEAAFALCPIGALFIICPGHNNVEQEMDIYISREKKKKEDAINVSMAENSSGRD